MTADSGVQRFGVTVPIASIGIPESLALARTCAALGYTEAWSSEVDRSDPFTPLAALAAGTDLVLATGVAQAFARPVPVTAMAAATLGLLSGGRFRLGLGTSTRRITEGWLDSAFDPPLERIEDTVTALRLCLSGERVDYRGRWVRVEGFRCRLGPVSVPIVLAALGPKMAALAGRVADGVMVNLVGPDMVERVTAPFFDSAGGSGRKDVIVRLWVAMADSSAPVRSELKKHLVAYGRVDQYNRHLAATGYPDLASSISSLGSNRAPDDIVPDQVVEDLFVLGDPAACRQRIAEYVGAGVTVPVVNPVATEGGTADRLAQVEHTLRELAPTSRKEEK